uniref:Reverse transcriptase zinc-binding domain-containing protein n=1 Tax=Fagus sylvatica TaxID=28930 RepID=A0A2N9HAP6_FAGSY
MWHLASWIRFARRSQSPLPYPPLTSLLLAGPRSQSPLPPPTHDLKPERRCRSELTEIETETPGSVYFPAPPIFSGDSPENFTAFTSGLAVISLARLVELQLSVLRRQWVPVAPPAPPGLTVALSALTLFRKENLHQRDGYKAIHVIRRSNQYGLYLEVSEFHSGSRKGVIRIPAGVEKQGWAQFSVFCTGHQNLAQKSTNERRRDVDKAAVMSKESEGGKPQILHQDFVFQNHATDPGKKAAALISVDMPKDLVNSRVQFLLNLELGCGPEGEWFVSRAELQKDESTRTHLTKQTNEPQSRPVTRQEWRPKVQANNITHQTPQIVLSPETSTQAECSHSEPSPSAVKARDTDDAVNNDDEHANDVGTSALQLRQGQRLFVPQMPPLPLTPNPFYALSSSDLCVEAPEKTESSEVWALDNSAHKPALETWEPSNSAIERDVEDWEDRAEWFVPLAIAYPAEESNGVSKSQTITAEGGEPVASGSQSEWVTEKMQVLGVVLGASYVGFEDRVLALLREIEAESRMGKPGGPSVKEKSRETKLMSVTQGLVRSLWRCKYVDWTSLDSIGASGGIILMWDRRVVERVDEAIGCFSISCRFREVASGLDWVFSGVYGPNKVVERRMMWDELAGIATVWAVPWCVGGDFNLVRYPSERAGASDLSSSMRDFSDFIFSMGLIDLPLEGGNFTLVQCPLQIKKLKSLKVDLRRWNKETFGDVNVRKHDLQAQIQDFDFLEETRPLTVEEGVAKDHLKTEFENMGWNFLPIEDSDRIILDRQFTEDEVWGVGGRQILDSVLVANESLDSCYEVRFPRMLSRAVSGGYISGFSVGNYTGAISGLKINLSKSELVPVGPVPNVPELAGILGCSVASLPLTYLGLPLGASFKMKSIWAGVVERMEKRLAGWKRLYLSKGGRVTLIKSTLSMVVWVFVVWPTFNKALLGKWLMALLKGAGILMEAGQVGMFFSQHISYKVGDGSRIRFWFDYQLGYRVHKISPGLGIGDGRVFHVPPLFSDQFARVLWTLFVGLLHAGGCLRFVLFTTTLISSHLPGIFPWKSVWKAKVPSRVAFFVWTAALGKILTTENLRKRRVTILDWCCMCKSSGESVNHLLVHCPVAWELWSMVLVIFGKNWVMPRDVVDLLSCWKEIRGKSKAGKIWKMVPHCLMWCLWQERNDRTFKEKERTIPALKLHFLHTLLNWSKAISFRWGMLFA